MDKGRQLVIDGKEISPLMDEWGGRLIFGRVLLLQALRAILLLKSGQFGNLKSNEGDELSKKAGAPEKPHHCRHRRRGTH